MRFAAIDLGTVTCRLLVADVCESRIVPIAKEYAIVNLGEGVDETHRLAPEALLRVKEALEHFLRIRDSLDMPQSPVLSTACVATSASRDAENSADLEAVFEDLGLSVQIISGEREAELTFLGVGSAFAEEALMVVDVGGGSTEIVFGSAGEHIESAHSYNIGSRRITERFLHKDPPTQSELSQAREYICKVLGSTEQLREIPAAIASCPERKSRLVAVAGTATSAVSIREEMAVYDLARVHGSSVTSEELAAITNQLASVPLQQREQTVGLDPKRAPVIVAGLVILQEVMQLYRQSSFTVSESDILSGIIISEYEKALTQLPK